MDIEKKDIFGKKVRNKIIANIQERLRKGEKRIEILNILSEEYFDKDVLRNLIAQSPDPEDVSELRRKSNFVFNVLIFYIFVKVYFNYSIAFSFNGIAVYYFLLIGSFVPLMALMMALEIRKMNGLYFKVLGLGALSVMFHTFSDIGKYCNSLEAKILIVTQYCACIQIIFICNLVIKKYYPHLGGVFRFLKKDNDGNILLGKEML